jgi:hypothetical protein
VCRASRNNRLVALAGAIVSIPSTPAACCHLQPIKPLAANAASAASWQCAAVDAGWAIHSPQCGADGGAQPQDHSPGPKGGHLIAPPSPWRAHSGRGGGSDRRCSAVRPRAAGWAALPRGPPAGEPRAATTATPARRGAIAAACGSPTPLPLYPGLQHRARGLRWVSSSHGRDGSNCGVPGSLLGSWLHDRRRAPIATDRARHGKAA